VKLFHSPASPFVRKVMASAIAREIEGQIELVPTNVHASPPDLVAANPLCKVPCLITEDGVALFDSPVICEYLDALEDGALPLFPRAGGARWRALKLQALADGIMEAAVLRRGESLRPMETARAAFMARQKEKVDRSVAALEADLPHQTIDIGSISAGCALGYLDFRFPHEPWRPAAPHLAAWFSGFSENPCMARTVLYEAR
jgi:glutathione S-transferase